MYCSKYKMNKNNTDPELFCKHLSRYYCFLRVALLCELICLCDGSRVVGGCLLSF